jgi:malate dehydrogenase
MVNAIVNDTCDVIPCCVIPGGEYGFKDTSITLPVALGKKGVKKIIDVNLNAEEKKLLTASVATVQKSIDFVKGQIKD